MHYNCCNSDFVFSNFRKGSVTSLGQQMVEIPLAPGLARTVINSVDIGCADLVLPVAAMLSVENVFASGGGKTKMTVATQCHREIAELAGGTNDFATLLYIYKECEARLASNCVSIFQHKPPVFPQLFITCNFHKNDKRMLVYVYS